MVATTVRLTPRARSPSARPTAAGRPQPIPPLAVAKKAMYGWDSMHFDKGLARAEKIYLDELMNVEDMQEGINAFLEKRPPVWKGK